MAAYTTIDDPSAYFQIKLYTAAGAYTFDGNSDMQPDWMWIKERNGTNEHNLFDSVRGTTKRLESSTNAAEQTSSTTLTAFGSDGFTVGTNPGTGQNGSNYVGWGWKETADAGFDIVTYSGSSASSKTVSHNLSAVPKMILVKCRSAGENWAVYHHTLGNTHALFLNTTGGSSDTPVFADTTPTASVFSVNADDRTGANGKTYVAYVFAEKQGFSKFGSWTGNANANGPSIYTGFKPAWLMLKTTASNSSNWQMLDNKRQGLNPENETLNPNNPDAEGTANTIDFVSNGFKIRTSNAEFNGDGLEYIYMAFAESPFVTSGGVPTTAK